MKYLKAFGLAWVILMVSEGILGFGHSLFYRDLSPIGSIILEISAIGLAITTGVLVRK